MNGEYYPWPGEFTVQDDRGCVAVVLLNIDYVPPGNVAIFGFLKTENIGIEKIVANVISNPNIRFVLLCGNEIRGHKSGESLLALSKNGIDNNNKIIGAPGAIPYIENLDIDAIERFQNQIEIVDLIGENDIEKINKKIYECISNNPGVYGKPYIAIRIESTKKFEIDDKRALHSKIKIDYLGKVEKRS